MDLRARDLLKTKPTATTEKGVERATAILEAARSTLVESGLAGLSMRGVAARVGISLGNLQHYYASKEELIEALVVYMMDGYQAEISAALTAHPSATADERFELIIGMLVERVQEPKTSSIFLEVWALSSRPGFAADLVRKVRAREHKAMMQLLRDLPNKASARRDLALRASMIVLVIEGLTAQLARHGVAPGVRAELAAAAVRTIARLATEAI